MPKPEITPALKEKFARFTELLSNYKPECYEPGVLEKCGGEFNELGRDYRFLLKTSLPSIYIYKTRGFEEVRKITHFSEDEIKDDEKELEKKGLSIDSIMELGKFVTEEKEDIVFKARAFAQGYINGNPFKNNEVRVYYDKRLMHVTVENIISGINKAINDIGLDLKIVSNEMEPLLRENKIPRAVNLLYDYDEGDSEDIDGITDDANWGNGERDGTLEMVLLKKGKELVFRQQDSDFLFTITKHEFFHVLGIEDNHKGYENIKCVMNWDPGTVKTLCEDCKEFLEYYGIGIEESTGKKWFK